MQHNDPKKEITLKPLSISKLSFLANEYQQLQQLTPKAYLKIAAHYFNKHHIRIYVNGTTDIGKKMLDENKASVRYHSDFHMVQDAKTKYAKLLMFFGTQALPGHIKGSLNALLLQHLNILEVLKQSKFSRDTIEKLNSICLQVPSYIDWFNKVEHKFFPALQKDFEAILQDQLDDCSLSKSQCVLEMNAIQKNLKPDEQVGYIHTENHMDISTHAECYILQKDKIIKLIVWNNSDVPNDGLEHLNSDHFNNTLYFTGLSRLLTRPSANEFSQPQTTSIGCASLGFLYLKELLKNNAKQLKHDSFMFEFYDQQGMIRQFFIPSPMVLRYSQSRTYNEWLNEIIMSDENFITKSKRSKKNPDEVTTRSIKTLKKLLHDSMMIATKINDMVMLEHNEDTLKKLATFRHRWFQGFQIASDLRERMQQGEHNLRLTYGTQQMKRKSEQESKHKRNFSL